MPAVPTALEPDYVVCTGGVSIFGAYRCATLRQSRQGSEKPPAVELMDARRDPFVSDGGTFTSFGGVNAIYWSSDTSA